MMMTMMMKKNKTIIIVVIKNQFKNQFKKNYLPLNNSKPSETADCKTCA